MVAMVALIGTRVDFYAMLHAIWLLAMFAMKREHIARLWTAYTSFIIVCIIIQYIMVVDVPPSLCVGKQQHKKFTSFPVFFLKSMWCLNVCSLFA